VPCARWSDQLASNSNSGLPDAPEPTAGEPPAGDAPQLAPAVVRFRSCRWRRPPEEGPECCSHRDVLPLAGTSGFNPEAWCPDCQYFKLRRTPRRQPRPDYW